MLGDSGDVSPLGSELPIIEMVALVRRQTKTSAPPSAVLANEGIAIRPHRMHRFSKRRGDGCARGVRKRDLKCAVRTCSSLVGSSYRDLGLEKAGLRTDTRLYHCRCETSHQCRRRWALSLNGKSPCTHTAFMSRNRCASLTNDSPGPRPAPCLRAYTIHLSARGNAESELAKPGVVCWGPEPDAVKRAVERRYARIPEIALAQRRAKYWRGDSGTGGEKWSLIPCDVREGALHRNPRAFPFTRRSPSYSTMLVSSSATRSFTLSTSPSRHPG